jgi:hypothetical protein
VSRSWGQPKHYWHGIGKDVVLFSSPPMDVEIHDYIPPEHINKRSFSMGGDQVVGRQKLHTTRSIAQMFVGVRCL